MKSRNRHLMYQAFDFFNGSSIVKSLSEINHMHRLTKEEIKHWQNLKLKKFIIHCYEHTDYFNELFKKNGISPIDIQCAEDLKILPPLTKEIIRKNFDRLIPDNINKLRYKQGHTGGSTAEPLKYLQDLKSWSYCNANSLYYWEKLSYTMGDKYISLGSSNINPGNKMSLKYRLYYLVKGKMSLSAINLGDEALKDYLDLIIKFKIKYIYGYATSIYLLAEMADKLKYDLSFLKGCISTSELLLPEYYKKIVETFRCDVIDAYGAGDGGITAFKFKTDYFEVGYNCLLDVQRAQEENQGNLYTTDILNLAFPFLRYEVGDGAEIGEVSDFNGQVIKELYGRIPNIIKLENGRTLIAPGFTVLFGGLNVNAYRIIKSGENSISVQIVKNSNYSMNDEAKIVNSFKYHAGEDCNLNIEYFDAFNTTNIGKRNYFIAKQLN